MQRNDILISYLKGYITFEEVINELIKMIERNVVDRFTMEDDK